MHDLITLRTCYYALCLISKTKKGVEQLRQQGWVSVCHSHEHKWPVVNKKATTTSVTPSPCILQRNNMKAPFHHQASLPAVILTSTDSSQDTAAARKKAMFKKSTSTMSSAGGKMLLHQKIVEDQVSEHVSEDIQVIGVVEPPIKMRYANSSSQQRPLSMVSLGNR